MKYLDFEPTAGQKVRIYVRKKHKQFIYSPYKYADISRIRPYDVSMSPDPEQKSKMWSKNEHLQFRMPRPNDPNDTTIFFDKLRPR